jgi:carbamate kinase
VTTHRQLVVVAVGGNALLRRGEPLEADLQQANVARAITSIAKLAGSYDLVLTHGNGPQVGLLALQAAAYQEVKPYPLDVLGAETDGMIGYLLERSLRNALPGRETATLLTQVVVDANDPAFAHPTKPIGPTYGKQEADRIATDLGWFVAQDSHGYRRVVASPEPRTIVELATIRLLVDVGVVVICGGGGGIPVTIDEHGALVGVEAVIDKDLSTAVLAAQLGADILLLLTDVSAVESDWGTARARALTHATPDELRTLHFESGSMGPKVEAACRFVDSTGRVASIGALDEATAIVEGRAGTRVAAR